MGIVDYSLCKYPSDKDFYNYEQLSGDASIEYEFKNKSLREVSVDMDESNLYEKIIDRMDQDRRDQEQRISTNIQIMEQRLSNDRRLMEERIVAERRLSEERMEKRFNETMETIKNTNNKIGGLENKLDEKTEKMLEKVDSTNKWIMGTCIATILAVAAIAASVWFK